MSVWFVQLFRGKPVLVGHEYLTSSPKCYAKRVFAESRFGTNWRWLVTPRLSLRVPLPERGR